MSFIKPVTVKSNTKIKSSERKQLLDSFCQQYGLTLSDLPTELQSTNIFRLKISTSDSEVVNVFKFSEQPLLISRAERVIPTVYLLWLLPSLLPHLVTHDAVVPKLTSGADLMIPGVVLDKQLISASFEKDALCAISTTTNRAPVAVGYAALPSRDLLQKPERGKAVLVYHVLGDRICSLGTAISFPMIPPVLDGSDVRSEVDASEDTNVATNVDVSGAGENVACETDPNQVLVECFLRGLRLVDDKQLPMHANVLYAQYMLPQSPSRTLDIRKTAYKKVGTFLRAMEQDSIIQLDEPKPGVLMVKSVKRDHQSFTNLPLSEASSSSQQSWPPGYHGPPTIEDVWTVTGPVSSLFTSVGLSSNSHVTQSQIHKAVAQYVQQNKLRRSKENKESDLILLDNVLLKFCDPNLFVEPPESSLAHPVHLIRFQDILRSMFDRMNKTCRITIPSSPESIILWRRKGLPCIELGISKRNGKDVTRITNVSYFGIDPDLFSKHLRSQLACSVTCIEDEGHSGDHCIVQAQGPHVIALSKMLTNVYQIPRKYIKGYEEPKKKKKK